MLGAKPPAQQQTGAGRHYPSDYQRSKGRPEQLANTPQIKIKRHCQGHRCRPKEDAHDFGAFAILAVRQATGEQYANDHQHRDQYRLKEDPAGFLIGRQYQLIGTQGDTDTKQRMMNDSVQCATPIQTHGCSSRLLCRAMSFCISTPTNTKVTNAEITKAPAMAQKSAAISAA
ncbi:hypothetical protein D3C72_1607490 [compost metagenome]